MVLLTMAAHVVPPLPAAPLDSAFKRHGLYIVLACCPHAHLTKKPICATNRLRLRLISIYAGHSEDAAEIPAKPTTKWQDYFRVQVEGNMNPHPPSGTVFQ